MAERTFNFHGANVTFNDIHDLTGCTIYTGRAEDISQQVESADAQQPAEQQPEHRFPYFSREATDKDRQEFEAHLREDAPKGNRYVVELFNTYAYYIDLRGVHTTHIHREMVDHWGLTTKRSSFAEAMINCKCIR